MSELMIGIVDEPNPGGSEDTLGVGEHSTALTQFIKQCPTPMTIGIQGEWGSGKTSILNQIAHALEDDTNKYKLIWVNAWEHSLLSTPELTLVKIIGEVIEEMTFGMEDTAAKEKVKKYARFAFQSAAMITAKAVAGTQGSKIVENAFGGDDKGNSIKMLRKELSSLSSSIKARPSNPHEKIIIFIDDLDRIEPKDAVGVLELLKNIFNIPNCVFVLAIDYQVVIKGLEHKFGKRTEENEWEFRAFFDKIIQLPFMMPMGQYNKGNYVSDLLRQIGFLRADDHFDEIINEIIDYTVGGNPRSLKRLVNSLALIKLFPNTAEEDEVDIADDLLLFSLVCLQISFPLIYDQLVKKPDFSTWDEGFAFLATQRKEESDKAKFAEELKIVASTEDFDEPWEQALFRICYVIPRYRGRASGISKFFNYLKGSLLKDKLKKETLGDVVERSLAKTSVTSVNTSDDAQTKASKPYQKTVFDDIDTLLKHKGSKGISENTDRMLRMICGYLNENIPQEYNVNYHPKGVSIKLGNNVIFAIEPRVKTIKVAFGTPYYQEGYLEKFMNNYGIQSKQIADKKWGLELQLKEQSEFESCKADIVTYLRAYLEGDHGRQ